MKLENSPKANGVPLGHHLWRVRYRDGSFNVFVHQRGVVHDETIFATHRELSSALLGGGYELPDEILRHTPEHFAVLFAKRYTMSTLFSRMHVVPKLSEHGSHIPR